jgi:cyclomaltodextrinase / maltogenic alpha-amylase / neopullulanase
MYEHPPVVRAECPVYTEQRRFPVSWGGIIPTARKLLVRNDLAIWHEPRPPYAYPQHDGRVRVRLRLALGDDRIPTLAWSDRQDWSGPDETGPMRWLADDAHFRYWEGEVIPIEGRVRYVFRLEGHDQPALWVGESGVTDVRPGNEWPDCYFHWPYVHPENIPHTPAWLRDAVGYEIFPDRFARGNPPIAPDIVREWREKVTHWSKWGGDLAGVLDALGYLDALGVNLLWLTPIFLSPSNHKYDTSDYSQIDPHFGTEELFARLVGEANAHGIRVLLDGVYNHAGINFAPWRDVLAHGSASPYWGWFDVQAQHADTTARNYRTFGHSAHMPRLRTANPEVQAYLIEHARRWMRMGIAGWRLDVADEVDTSFWRAFRREMRAINPDAYFVGEITYNAGRWLDGSQFDGVMNYPLRRALIQFLAPDREVTGAPPPHERLDATGFLSALGQLRTWSPDWAMPAMLNPLSTHDVPRFLTVMGEDARRWRLGLFFLLAYEGIPLIYYGDEIGLKGGYDPDNRRPMIWDSGQQNAEMLATTRQLIALRQGLSALRSSGFRPLATQHPRVAAFMRGGQHDDKVSDVALVVINASEAPAEVTLSLEGTAPVTLPNWPDVSSARDLLTETRHPVTHGSLTLRLPALDAALIVPE